jgi:hypothetical protein
VIYYSKGLSLIKSLLSFHVDKDVKAAIERRRYQFIACRVLFSVLCTNVRAV